MENIGFYFTLAAWEKVVGYGVIAIIAVVAIINAIVEWTKEKKRSGKK